MDYINQDLYGDFILSSRQKLAIECTKTLCSVDNFMIGYNLDIFKITSGNSPWSNTIVFFIKNNARNIKYLTNNCDKEFDIFVNRYLYKCYKIKSFRPNKNNITVEVDDFDNFDDIII